MTTLLAIAEGAARLVSGSGRRPLGFEVFAESVERLTESPGFWGDEIEPSLRVLLNAYEAEAELSALGRLAVRWDIVRYLANLRRLAEEEYRDPEIGSEPIEAPIVITGLPRSGSTFLHTLLAEDPANLVLRTWQAIYPYPSDGRRGIDHTALRVDRQLRSFALLTPGIRNLYPLDGRAPQECTEITAHVFQSLRFEATHHVPSYKHWLKGHGHLAAYQFHKRFLRHIQHQNPGRRWVLKSPDHVFAIEALASVYPDARIVFMHRDPKRVIPSVAQLTEALRVPFTQRVDLKQIGRQVTADWTAGATKMIDVVRSGLFPHKRIFHLHYHDLVSRPLDAIRRLYGHFDLTLDAEAAERIGAVVAAKPDGGYGRNSYSFDRHGIDPDDLRARFRDYTHYFDVALDADPASGRSDPPGIVASRRSSPHVDS
ncbi:MAG TPA: sulfotransferase [Alphaproteobacteria bacterium]|nr:sulfotransferase [Alphaproteobacteria bacterium]